MWDPQGCSFVSEVAGAAATGGERWVNSKVNGQLNLVDDFLNYFLEPNEGFSFIHSHRWCQVTRVMCGALGN